MSFQSVYTDEEYNRLSNLYGDGDEPYAEPYSVVEVEITDDGQIFVTYIGPPGIMVTEGELDVRRLLPEDKQKELALHWKATRRRINRDQPYPHQWVE